MTRPGRSVLARLYEQFDHKVSAPASYVAGYVRTRLSGGRFGRFPSIEGPVELRIRGVAVVGKHFEAHGVTWRARIEVGREGVLRIGDDFRMNDGASVQAWHEVTIGNNVMMAPFSSIIDDHCHLLEPDSVMYERPVVIGDNVWLGKNATVLPGVTIGPGSVIAANSVVSRDLPPNSLAAGSPATVVRVLDIPPGWTHCYGYDGYWPGREIVSSLKRAVAAR